MGACTSAKKEEPVKANNPIPLPEPKKEEPPEEPKPEENKEEVIKEEEPVQDNPVIEPVKAVPLAVDIEVTIDTFTKKFPKDTKVETVKSEFNSANPEKECFLLKLHEQLIDSNETLNDIYEREKLNNKDLLNNNEGETEQERKITFELCIGLTNLTNDNTYLESSNLIAKPTSNPFEVYVFNKANVTFKLANIEEDKKIYNSLVNYSSTMCSYCNGINTLFISGSYEEGEDNPETKNSFWIINLEDFEINQINPINFLNQVNEEEVIQTAIQNHSMIFVPNDYVFMIGGTLEYTIFCNKSNEKFYPWAPLNNNMREPSLCLINNNVIYAFDNLKDNSEAKTIFEKTDLTNVPKWEMIDINKDEELNFNQIFFGALPIEESNKILFLGGNLDTEENVNEEELKNFEFDYQGNTLKQSEVPFEKVDLEEKTMSLYNNHGFLITNFVPEHPVIMIYSNRQNKLKTVHFDMDKIAQISPFKNKDSVFNSAANSMFNSVFTIPKTNKNAFNFNIEDAKLFNKDGEIEEIKENEEEGEEQNGMNGEDELQSRKNEGMEPNNVENSFKNENGNNENNESKEEVQIEELGVPQLEIEENNEENKEGEAERENNASNQSYPKLEDDENKKEKGSENANDNIEGQENQENKDQIENPNELENNNNQEPNNSQENQEHISEQKNNDLLVPNLDMPDKNEEPELENNNLDPNNNLEDLVPPKIDVIEEEKKDEEMNNEEQKSPVDENLNVPNIEIPNIEENNNENPNEGEIHQEGNGDQQQPIEVQ